MQHSWDPDKERRNVAKHGLDFTFAELHIGDPHLVSVFDRVEDGEERWHAVGRVGEHRVLVVVHTYPDPSNDAAVRIIGVREATRGENPL